VSLTIGSVYGGVGSTLIGPVENGFEPQYIVDPRTAYLVKETIEYNWPGLKYSPDLDAFQNEKIDLLVAQPKCSDYSLLNRTKTRDDLYRVDPYQVEYVKFLQQVNKRKPEFFILENLPRIREFLFFPHNGNTFYAAVEVERGKPRTIEAVVELPNYKILQFDINAVNFGIPQFRRRLFIIGHLKKYNFIYEPPVLEEKDYKTVRQAFQGLHNGMLNYSGDRELTEKMASKIVRCLPGQKTPNKERRLEFDKPSPTIVSSSIRHIHPVKHRYLRKIECSRLMSYPDSFKFFGSENQCLDQIGRAICPPINLHISTVIKKSLLKYHQSSQINNILDGIML